MAVEPNYRCGQCARCRSGEYNICAHFGFAGLMGDGGLAEYATVPGYMVHPLPEAVPLLQAALFEPASVALHALRRGGVTTGSRVAVAGLGPVGLLTVQLARAHGATWIAGLDPLPQRRQLARELGADAAYETWPCWDGDARTVDAAFEVAGVQGALDGCLAATRTGGRIVLAGLGGQFSFDSAALVNSERSLIATVGYRDTYPELIQLVAEEGLDLTRIVTSVVPLQQVVERGLHAPPGEIKVLVRPR